MYTEIYPLVFSVIFSGNYIAKLYMFQGLVIVNAELYLALLTNSLSRSQGLMMMMCSSWVKVRGEGQG